jgi:hypothetical protein
MNQVPGRIRRNKRRKIEKRKPLMKNELSVNLKINTQCRLSLKLPVVRKTFSAVNRPSFSWLERNFGLNTAVRTGYFGHFPGAAVAASETSTVAVSVAAAEGIPSVIKTHICFTSAYNG